MVWNDVYYKEHGQNPFCYSEESDLYLAYNNGFFDGAWEYEMEVLGC